MDASSNTAKRNREEEKREEKEKNYRNVLISVFLVSKIVLINNSV